MTLIGGKDGVGTFFFSVDGVNVLDEVIVLILLLPIALLLEGFTIGVEGIGDIKSSKSLPISNDTERDADLCRGVVTENGDDDNDDAVAVVVVVVEFCLVDSDFDEIF